VKILSYPIEQRNWCSHRTCRFSHSCTMLFHTSLVDLQGWNSSHLLLPLQ